MEHAGGPVRQLGHPVVLGIEHPLGIALPGQGGLGVVEVPLVHIPLVPHLSTGVEDGPAVVVGDLRCVQLPGGEGLGHRLYPARGCIGRVHDAAAHQRRQRDPPQDGQKDHGHAGGDQIPPEQRRQASGPSQPFFHL